MTTAAEVIDELLPRVRDDVAGRVHDRAFVLDLVDRLQRVVARSQGLLIGDRFLLTEHERCIYDVDTTEVLRVVDVRLGERLLSPTRWTRYSQLRRDWWRHGSGELSEVLQSWAPFGPSKMIVWPAIRLPLPQTLVSMRVQLQPTPLVAEITDLDIPDEYVPQLLDLAEAFLLYKQKDEALPDALERLVRSES